MTNADTKKAKRRKRQQDNQHLPGTYDENESFKEFKAGGRLA